MNFRNKYDIGLEVEFSNTLRELNSFLQTVRNRLPGFNLQHDGSVETFFPSHRGILLSLNNEGNASKLSGILNSIPIVKGGGEIVSPILDGESNNWQSQIYTICDILEHEFDFTDTDNIDRASIHVHLNLSDSFSLRELKNLVRLSLAFEPFLYRLGGMGRLNRCSLNNFTFSRPILYPSVYNYKDNYYPMFSATAMLEAESVEEFFDLFYNAIWARNHDIKYFPARYVGINFYSLLIRNSIELRYANFTNIPEYIIAWIMLCRQYVIKASQSETSLLNTIRSLETFYTKDDLLEFLSYIQITDPYTKILLDMWNKSYVTFDGTYCKSHVDTFETDPKMLKVFKVDKKFIKDPSPRNAREIQNKVHRDVEYAIVKNRTRACIDPEKDYKVVSLDGNKPVDKKQQFKPIFENIFDPVAKINLPVELEMFEMGLNNAIEKNEEAFWNDFPYNIRGSNLNKVRYVKTRFVGEVACFLSPVFTDFGVHSFKMKKRGMEIKVLFRLVKIREELYVRLSIENLKTKYKYDPALIKLDYDIRKHGYYFYTAVVMEEFFNVQNNNN